jgi:predicted outer membrane protein
MRGFKLRISAAAFAVAVLGLASWALAQRNDPNARQDPQGQSNPVATQQGQLGQPILDQMAAEGMLQTNKGEIELANFALKHTQNEEVRKFAQTIVNDQTNLNKQLQRFVSEQGAGQEGNLPGGTSATQPASPGPRAVQPGRESAGPTAQAGGTPGDSSWCRKPGRGQHRT